MACVCGECRARGEGEGKQSLKQSLRRERPLAAAPALASFASRCLLLRPSRPLLPFICGRPLPTPAAPASPAQSPRPPQRSPLDGPWPRPRPRPAAQTRLPAAALLAAPHPRPPRPRRPPRPPWLAGRSTPPRSGEHRGREGERREKGRGARERAVSIPASASGCALSRLLSGARQIDGARSLRSPAPPLRWLVPTYAPTLRWRGAPIRPPPHLPGRAPKPNSLTAHHQRSIITPPLSIATSACPAPPSLASWAVASWAACWPRRR